MTLLALIKLVDWCSGSKAAGPEGETVVNQQDLYSSTACAHVGHVGLLFPKTAIPELDSGALGKLQNACSLQLSSIKLNKP